MFAGWFFERDIAQAFRGWPGSKVEQGFVRPRRRCNVADALIARGLSMPAALFRRTDSYHFLVQISPPYSPDP